jgi:hypothetical protein
MTTLTGTFRRPAQAALIALLATAALGFGSVALAQDEDLSDNAVCLECHADTEHPANDPSITRPQVHQPDGSFFVEDHEMWSCNDCHTYITEIPHPDGVEDMTVDCTNCHDEEPVK